MTSSTAIADEKAAQQKDAALIRAEKREGVVCRRIKETGSRTSKKVCTTKAQREARSRRAQDDLERVQRRGELSPTAN